MQNQIVHVASFKTEDTLLLPVASGSQSPPKHLDLVVSHIMDNIFLPNRSIDLNSF